MTNKDHQLPLLSGPLLISYRGADGPSFEATVSQHSGVTLIVGLDDIKVSLIEYVGKCQIEMRTPLKGCKACNSGAQAKLKCESKLPITTNIYCDELNQFTIICDNQSYEINIQTQEENYDVICSYECAVYNGTLRIQGTLDSIQVNQYGDKEISGWWAKPAVDIPISRIAEDMLGAITQMAVGLLKLILTNPIAILIAIIGIVIIIIWIRGHCHTEAIGPFAGYPYIRVGQDRHRRRKTHDC